jgi:hypothetical protein
MKLKLTAIILGLLVFSTAQAQTTKEHPFLAQVKKLSTEKSTSDLNKETPADEPVLVSVEKPKQTNSYVRPSAKKRFNSYVNNTIGPVALASNAAVAGLTTLTNNPEEWEKTGEGFARRFASRMGETAIQQTTMYGLDEALKIDSKFYKSKKRDFGSKVKNAFVSTFTARNEKGKRVVGVSRITGTYASRIISREAWYPDRFNYKDGLRSGSISLGVNVAVNLFREFF